LARCARLFWGAVNSLGAACSLREGAALSCGGPAAELRCYSKLPLLLPVLFLAACSSQLPRVPAPEPEPEPAVKAPAPKTASIKPGYTLKKGGGYYMDDGPGDNAPDNIDTIPDAVPRDESLHRFANRPYSVLGRDYAPMRELKPYKARGIGSWYGRKFHGQKTSSGEVYDMYGMTAAHTTLPLPCYVRVTNLANGKSVVVRVNDRGPFHSDRLIDLSYTAAHKLGYVGNGSAMVEVEIVQPGDTLFASAARNPVLDADPLAELTAAAAQIDANPAALATEPAEPPVPTVAGLRGVFLQLGAFGSQDNAESFRARVAPQLAGISGSLQIQPKGGVYRIHLGPFADAQEANRVANKIRDTLDFKPFVVQR